VIIRFAKWLWAGMLEQAEIQSGDREIRELKQKLAKATEGWNRAAGEVAAYRRADELARANEQNMGSMSPSQRQNNEIRRMTERLLAQPPGPGYALVKFLASTLDIELPERWQQMQRQATEP
jgi:hypothetical protein